MKKWKYQWNIFFRRFSLRFPQYVVLFSFPHVCNILDVSIANEYKRLFLHRCESISFGLLFCFFFLLISSSYSSLFFEIPYRTRIYHVLCDSEESSLRQWLPLKTQTLWVLLYIKFYFFSFVILFMGDIIFTQSNGVYDVSHIHFKSDCIDFIFVIWISFQMIYINVSSSEQKLRLSI